MKKITQISRERALIAFHNFFDMLLFVIFLVFYIYRRVEDSSRKGAFGEENLSKKALKDMAGSAGLYTAELWRCNCIGRYTCER